jgi:hypothetical protein
MTQHKAEIPIRFEDFDTVCAVAGCTARQMPNHTWRVSYPSHHTPVYVNCFGVEQPLIKIGDGAETYTLIGDHYQVTGLWQPIQGGMAEVILLAMGDRRTARTKPTAKQTARISRNAYPSVISSDFVGMSRHMRRTPRCERVRNH